MDDRNIPAVAAIPALLLFGLHLYGYFFPGSMNWGFHFLGFLSPAFLVMYIIAYGLIFLLFRNGKLQHMFSRVAEFFNVKPAVSLFVISIIYIIAASVFRVQVPLLGDSFTFIKNFTDAFSGADRLGVWHEPAAMYFFSFILEAFKSTTTGEIITTFFWLDVVMGMAYILVLFGLTKELFADEGIRFSVFLWMLLLPTTVFFFGYVEIYALTLLCLMTVVYLSVLVLNNKLSFIFLPSSYLLLVLIHLLNGLLGPALLYVTYVVIKEKRIKEAVIGIAISFILLFAVLYLVDFDINRLSDQSSISHFLSLDENISMVNAYSQAFTLFSTAHGIELMNYFLLMSPFAIILIVYALRSGIRTFFGSAPGVFFAIISSSYFFLICITKIQQGMGNDWDVFAGYFVPITLCSALMLSPQSANAHYARRIFMLIVSVTAVHSLIWFSINSTEETNIRRVQSLFDRNMISQLGHYTISLHISRYYDYRGDTLAQGEIWERYAGLFPADPRGYGNTLQYLKKFSPPDYYRIARVYDAWRKIDPSNSMIASDYAGVCNDAGAYFFSRDSLQASALFFEKAVTLDPNSPDVLNNYGSVLARSGKLQQAVQYFLAAAEADPAYPKAHYNLGMAYEELGEKVKSAQALREAARLGSREAQEYLQNLQRQ